MILLGCFERINGIKKHPNFIKKGCSICNLSILVYSLINLLVAPSLNLRM